MWKSELNSLKLNYRGKLRKVDDDKKSIEVGGYEFIKEKNEEGTIFPLIAYYESRYDNLDLFPENFTKEGHHIAYSGYQYHICISDLDDLPLDDEVARNNVELFQKLLNDLSSEKRFFEYEVDESDFQKFCESMLQKDNRTKHVKQIKKRILFFNEQFLENQKNLTNGLTIDEESKLKTEIIALEKQLHDKQLKLRKKPAKTIEELEKEVNEKYPMFWNKPPKANR